MLMIEPGTKNGEILRGPLLMIGHARVLYHRQSTDA